jgi:hypothetical protein
VSEDIRKFPRFKEFLETLRAHYTELISLIDAWLGVAPAPPEEKRRLEIPKEIPKAIEKVVPVPPATIVKTKPYDEHFFTVVPKPLNYTGDYFDLGKEYDLVIVIPSIDAQIEFDKPIESSTPVVAGGTALNAELKVRRIYFKAVSTTVEGTISIWAFRYKEG